MSITPEIALQQIIQNSQQVILEEQQNIQLAQSGLAYVPPAPPQDLADYLLPKPGRFVRDVFARLLPGGRTGYYLVRPTGNNYPMDGKVLTTSDTDAAPGLYDVLTDFPGHWNNPKAYRLYTNSNPGTAQKGLKLAPRYFLPNQPRIQVASYHGSSLVTTEQHTDCSVFATGQYQADTFFRVQPGVNFGGDLGVQDAPVSEYYYDWSTALAKQLKKAQQEEEFYFVLGSSWAWWIHYQLQPDGSYLKDKEALYNTFIPDTTAVPVLPCSVVL